MIKSTQLNITVPIDSNEEGESHLHPVYKLVQCEINRFNYSRARDCLFPCQLHNQLKRKVSLLDDLKQVFGNLFIFGPVFGERVCKNA